MNYEIPAINSLDHSENSLIVISDGRIKLHFLPNNNTDYDEKITISIGKVEDDAPLSECMDLVVGNFQDSEDLELGLTGLS